MHGITEIGTVFVNGIEYQILAGDLVVTEHPGLLTQIACDNRVSVFQQKKRLSRIYYFKVAGDKELDSLREKWSRVQVATCV